LSQRKKPPEIGTLLWKGLKWGGYFIDNCFRRWLHNPAKTVGPYVKPGMTVMDVGCGMGLFSLFIQPFH
jgi:hypothetical protein